MRRRSLAATISAVEAETWTGLDPIDCLAATAAAVAAVDDGLDEDWKEEVSDHARESEDGVGEKGSVSGVGGALRLSEGRNCMVLLMTMMLVDYTLRVML